MFGLSKDILSAPYAELLLNRFLKYVKVCSQSDSSKADSGILPSTSEQWNIAKMLCEELKSLNLCDVQVTNNCYVYGYLPATKGLENAPSFCLLAHLDTVDEVSGKDVKPIVHKNYNGNKIELTFNVVLDPSLDKNLLQAASQNDTIITSDGSTLLGADDKAGIAEIVTALEFFANNPEAKHGLIEVIFSPDEETGHGMDKVPLELLKSKLCYTVDGGHIGELETECFNAYKTDITFTGKSKHTGDARPDMVNAVCMASSFVANLPRNQMPETTDGYMGFYAPLEIFGSIESAKVTLLLRDFTLSGIETKKQTVELIAQMISKTFGGQVKVEHKMQYLNMKDKLDQNPLVVQKLVQAYKQVGVTPVFKPIRGGTDGSRLTEMGFPTPNIFTGGHNYHSRYEWASLTQMVYATQILIELANQWTIEN